MTLQPISLEQALSLGRSMPYALLRTYSAVTLGVTPEVFSLSELLEARLFGPEGEIRIFHEDGDLHATALWETENTDYLDRQVALQPAFGHQLTKRSYLLYDADGQCQVRYTRLLHWEGDK